MEPGLSLSLSRSVFLLLSPSQILEPSARMLESDVFAGRDATSRGRVLDPCPGRFATGLPCVAFEHHSRKQDLRRFTGTARICALASAA